MQRRSFMQESQEPPPDDAALFDRFGPLLFAYILKHARSREDAEDLTLEVFTTVLENKHVSRLRPEEQLAWLKKVARNKLIDTYRRAQHRSSVTLDSFADTLYDHDEPERVVLQREADALLHQHIRKLSPLQQQLLYLRYAHGMRSSEIGTLLNKSAEAIRQQLSRARMLLRASYLKQEQNGGRSC